MSELPRTLFDAHVTGGRLLNDSLVREINEYFLFHGTKQNMLKSIENNGLDARVSNDSMFGNGVYFAESSTKADQYTGDARLVNFPLPQKASYLK